MISQAADDFVIIVVIPPIHPYLPLIPKYMLKSEFFKSRRISSIWPTLSVRDKKTHAELCKLFIQVYKSRFDVFASRFGYWKYHMLSFVIFSFFDVINKFWI